MERLLGWNEIFLAFYKEHTKESTRQREVICEEIQETK